MKFQTKAHTSNHQANLQGSIWHRWEPHIHTPGTIMNDMYSGNDPWDDFLNRIEQSAPQIKVLGITDYYSIESYEKTLQAKATGRLSGVELIFPNIELRFLLGTAKNVAINGHLLISPEDPEHVEQAKRFLQNLDYSVGREKFRCQKEDLTRLGKFHDDKIIDDVKALEAGTNQFKVIFSQLESAFKDSAWARKNILLAVSANTGDGTSGLNNDATFSSIRQHIERTSQIIFAGSEAQRKFWLGQGPASLAQLVEKYNGCKPCIHGSDAHTNEKVGRPDLDRYTWIKGDLKFESLRQICIEPADRVIVGPVPSNNQISSNIIEEVIITNADWVTPDNIQLNSGLVAIIGARGSGKTALADLIAVGGMAISSQLSDASFINRAKEYLATVDIELKWQTGRSTHQAVGEVEFEDLIDSPRVQYLSQQFVDKLCSSEGMTDELMDEIERVIFVSHPQEDRLGFTDFQELLSQRAAIPRQERENQQEIIETSSQELNAERIKKLNLPGLQKKFKEKEALVKTDKDNRQKLMITGNNVRLTEFQTVSTALDKVTLLLEQAQRKRQALGELKQEIDKARTSTFPNYTKKLSSTYSSTGLTATQWKNFEVDFKIDVSKIVNEEITNADKAVLEIKGAPLTIAKYDETSLLPTGVALEKVDFETLTQEVARLKHLIGIDSEKGKQYTRLSERIIKEEAELEKIKKQIVDANGVADRSKAIQETRRKAYNEVFKAIIEEEKQLTELYRPLMNNLTTQKGSLSQLTFEVQRSADISAWAAAGEELLDLRKNGPFKGKGTLLNHANNELKKIWETGTTDEIANAIAKFRTNHEHSILEHAQVEKADQIGYANWLNKVSSWLYSTDHITVNYSVRYDGVDIRQLSPGTRGIVLLLLYLAIDKEDDRPLIIDQPEENLDPKSIFDELVPLFRKVKSRRQIIIVTHNANLVVNTDADQVIVANCGHHRPNQLPKITYTSGGLENPIIRQQVCSILEGGEDAFKERAKRLRVAL
ncbi:TrlF family AAA-like ATPase [Niabella hirudinis]|uniref:TrlF family AAA-like ATPase n=1 Tax=Niabella hirudinis TaxID=1285929 RepID=UPI003EB877C4